MKKAQNPKSKFQMTTSFFALFILGCASSQVAQKSETQTKVQEIETPRSEAQKRYFFGYDYLKMGMYDEAIKNFESAVQESTTYVDAYINLGSAYMKKQEYGEAQRIYENLIEVVPVKGHCALGGYYLAIRQNDRAVEEYKKALAIDSTSSDAWYGVSYAYEKLGKLDLAIENYKLALKFEPSNDGIRYNLGKAYITKEQYAQGINELKTLLEKHPDDYDVRATYGKALMGTKDFAGALREFTFIAEKSPYDITARINKGKAYEGMKDYKSAVSSYEEAAAIDSTNVSPYCYLLNLYIEISELTKAAQVLQAAKAIAPDDQLLYYLSGSLAIQQGDASFNKKEFEKTKASYNKAISEFKLALQGNDANLVDNAKKAIESAEKKIKRAEEEAWWH